MSFFREALTILAALLLLALSAALAAPWFIDWTAQRGWVESTLSEAVGARVEIAGAIDVKLLPAPVLDLSRVSVRGATAGDPRLDVDRLRLEMAMAPLLRGAIRFVEASLDKPRLTLVVGPDGAVVLPTAPASAPDEVAFERIATRGGIVVLERPDAAPLTLQDVTLDAEATSLNGPFKASGSLRAPAGEMSFRFGSAAFEGERLRIKGVVEGLPWAPHAELDGALISTRSGLGTRLSLEGAATLTGAVQTDDLSLPWRATGTLVADSQRAQLDPMDLRFGEDRQTGAAGALRWDGASGVVQAQLAASRLDLDRLLSDKQPARAMQRAARAAGQALTRATGSAGGLSVRIDLTSPTVQIGGETLTETRLSYRSPTRGADGAVALEASLPGRARLSFDGALEGGAAARFAGKVSAAAQDLPRLADWLAQVDESAAQRLRDLPVSSLEASGDISLSRAAVSARDLTIRLDRSTFTGAMAFTGPVGGERARLFADLASPSLDVDGLPDLTGAARASADADLNLALEARAVRVARVGDGMVDAGRIRMKLTRDAGVLALERLSIENLGGATLTASGRADSGSARIEAKLDAQRLVELAALWRRVAPGALAERFADRAVALSPARLSFDAEAGFQDGAVELRALKIDGTVRGTRIVGSARPTGAELEAELDLSSADTPMLLRQLGLEALPLNVTPRSRVVARGKVTPGRGASGQVTADIAGVSFAYEGALQTDLDGPGGAGRLRVTANDAGPLLQTLAIATPDAFAAVPVNLTASIGMKGGLVMLDDLAGEVAGSRVAGSLRTERRESRGRLGLSGALAVDRLPLATLTGLALGAPGPRRAGALWSDRPFGPGLADPPSTRLTLKVDSLDIRDGLVGRDASLRLGVDPGLVALEDISLRLPTGRATGRLVVRRDKRDAALSGRLDLQSALEGRPDVAGRARVRLDIAATGASEAALVAGLAGSGAVELADAVFRRAEPAALDRVIAAAEKDTLAADERVVTGALAKALASGELRVPAVSFEAVLASGVLRLQPTILPGVTGPQPTPDVRANATLDLRTLAFEETLVFTSRAPPPGWTDAPPQARLVWSGPFPRPVQTVEAGALVNGLSARAIMRESARIDALEADIRERAFFNRRLKAQEWLRQREAEIAAWKVEQARRAEEERKRAEAERLRAEAERAKAEADRARAEVERQRAEEDQRRADEARRRAAEARQEQEKTLRSIIERGPVAPPLELVPRP